MLAGRRAEAEGGPSGAFLLVPSPIPHHQHPSMSNQAPGKKMVINWVDSNRTRGCDRQPVITYRYQTNL